MKKALFLFSIFLLVQGRAFSQTPDSLWENNRKDSIIKYMSPLEYAFMMHEETKFMLRVPAIGVGVEVELLPYLTVVAESRWNLLFNGELRWYYGSKRKGVRNMSGNYIAGGYSNENIFFSSQYYGDFSFARWGMQRRFLGNGLIDVGVNAGYRKSRLNEDLFNGNRNYNYEHFRLTTISSLGLGFVFNKNKFIDRDKVCPVVKCYDIEKFLLKINLNDLGTIDYFPNDKIFFANLRPSVAVEQKLFNSAFSLNVDARAYLTAGNRTGYQQESQEFETRLMRPEVSGEIRWYYNMRRRMLNGKGGNGLSANYIAGGGRQTFRGSFENFRDYRPAYMFVTGVQRTIGNRLYFDVQTGIIEDEYDGFFLLDIRAGIKF